MIAKPVIYNFMKKTKTKQSLLEKKVVQLQEEAENKPLSVKKILQILSGKGRPLVILLLSIPFCQPLQIPGLSTPFGLLIAFMGLRMAFGKNAWLPKYLLEKQIEASTMQKIIHKTLWLVQKMKPWVYSRLPELCNARAAIIVHGVVIFFLGIFLALPLPIPLSNLIAAWSLFLMSLGLLESDSLLVLVSYIIAIFVFLAFWGVIASLQFVLQ